MTRAQRLERQEREKKKDKEKDVIASLQGQYLEMVPKVMRSKMHAVRMHAHRRART